MVAQDNLGAESSTPVQAQVTVNPVNDAPETAVAPTSVSPLLVDTVNDADNTAHELHGATGLKIVDVGGTAFAIVTGTLDSGVSAFRINTDGTLTNTSNVNDVDPSLALAFARAVESAEIGGTTYVFVAGRELDHRADPLSAPAKRYSASPSRRRKNSE